MFIRDSSKAVEGSLYNNANFKNVAVILFSKIRRSVILGVDCSYSAFFYAGKKEKKNREELPTTSKRD